MSVLLLASAVVLLVVAIVAAGRCVARRRSVVEADLPRAEPAEPVSEASERAARGPVPMSALEEQLARWTAATLLTDEQAAAILAYERAPVHEPTVARPSTPAWRRAVPAVAEVLGYLGGILAIVGLLLVVARYWPDMATGGRLALSGAGALVLLAAGALVDDAAKPERARLCGFLWFASAAATALFAAVLATDAFGVEQPDAVALASSGAVALESGLLWRLHDRPLQQLAFLGGVAASSGALVSLFAGFGPIGLTVWIVGAVLLTLGFRRAVPSAMLTEAVGVAALVAGAVMSSAEWDAFALLFAVATAFGLLAVALAPGPVPTRGEQRLVGIAGGVMLLEAVPVALSYFAYEAGVVTGVVTWVVGAGLVVAAARRLVRLPVLVETLGGAALVGGAAVTRAQSPGFAVIFGIATAVGLLGLGTRPGRVLMTLFGSLGLLVNVPMAIGWFFPGEGRAPVLVLVSGVVLLAVAVLLARTGGRFRRELGGFRWRRAQPRGTTVVPRAAPPTPAARERGRASWAARHRPVAH